MKQQSIKLTCLALLLSSSFANAWNLRTSPTTMFSGPSDSMLNGPWVNVEADLIMNQQWTLGPTVTVSQNLLDWQLGIRANRYKENALQKGWFSSLEMNLNFFEANCYEVNDSCPMDTDWEKTDRYVSVRSRALQNYHFQWDTLNLDLGIGSELLIKAGDSGVYLIDMNPAAEFSLGWIF